MNFIGYRTYFIIYCFIAKNNDFNIRMFKNVFIFISTNCRIDRNMNQSSLGKSHIDKIPFRFISAYCCNFVTFFITHDK